MKELRVKMLVVLIAFSAFFVISIYLSGSILLFMLHPLKETLPSQGQIVYTGIADAFSVKLKISFFSALIATFPIFLLEVGLFIFPALYTREKKIAFIILILCPCLFLSGAALARFIVMPTAWKFLFSFGNQEMTFLPTVDRYLSLCFSLMIGFGMAFQLPIVTIVANLIGFISVEKIRKKRRIAIILFFIVAAVLTPPDVMSQLILAIPLYLLYEISLFVCTLLEKDKLKKNIKKIQNNTQKLSDENSSN